MHPKFQHDAATTPWRSRPADGSSGANELIVTGGHVGTHIDAFAHISYDGRLHGGIDASAAQTGGRFTRHGAETIAPMIGRGSCSTWPRPSASTGAQQPTR